FSSEKMTIEGKNGNTIRFKLSNGKGYGSMPLEHMNYLIRKGFLTPNMDNAHLKEEIKNREEHQEDQIG
ncbi:hypothetical protein, partial [Pseudomonas sp. 2995-1]|uniref:hypothetical protein n=1 Tax=Pseudomonas sp. 2995-1 TaxID=1712679 RepID=UPI000C14D19C